MFSAARTLAGFWLSCAPGPARHYQGMQLRRPTVTALVCALVGGVFLTGASAASLQPFSTVVQAPVLSLVPAATSVPTQRDTADHVVSSVPTRPPPLTPAARPSDPSGKSNAVMPFVQVQQLGEDLVRLQLDLHRALTDRTSQDVTVRSRKLAELRVTSPMDLRVLVSQLRSTRIASEVLSRARRVASLIYPNLPATLPRPDLAAVLAAAAAEHDRKALVLATPDPDEEPQLLSALRAGEMIVRAIPSRRSRPLPMLLKAHESLLRRYERAAKAAAHAALQRASVYDPSASDVLVAAWANAGYRRSNAVFEALTHMDKPYRFGARGPDSFDCSGLTSVAWAHSGLHLKTSSFSQRRQVVEIGTDPADLLPGDLVFYKVVPGDAGLPSGHVAMALGFGILVVEALQNVSKVHVAPYAHKRVSTFGRVRLAGERTDGLLIR